ncbi:MAG: histidine phosphatase family protein [Xanthobacteraceae bacterium]
MRRLILLRHAKSDRGNPSLADIARPLNPRGQEAATRIGAYMAKHDLLPDLVLCSTAERARETWDLVAKGFTKPPPATFDKRLYNADVDRIVTVVHETPMDSHTVMVVGHNPGMQDAATSLLAAGDVEQRANLLQKLPTGGLIVIDFAVDDWASVHPRSGRLDRFVTPRRLTPDTA